MTDELSKCESQKLRQPFWELTYGQAVYIVVVLCISLKACNIFKCVVWIPRPLSKLVSYQLCLARLQRGFHIGKFSQWNTEDIHHMTVTILNTEYTQRRHMSWTWIMGITVCYMYCAGYLGSSYFSLALIVITMQKCIRFSTKENCQWKGNKSRLKIGLFVCKCQGCLCRLSIMTPTNFFPQILFQFWIES